MSENWYDLARESRKAASNLTTLGFHRSAISRAYYAIYSCVSFELVSLGVSMPVDRDGPAHLKLPQLILTRLTRLNYEK